MPFSPSHFNPDYPQCPQCGAGLTESSRIDSVRYEDKGLTLHVHICRVCGAATGYVVADEPKPNDPYVVKKIY